MGLLRLVFVLAVAVVWAAEDNEDQKRTKMTACLDLARIRLDRDEKDIDEMVKSTTVDHGRLVNKIVAEMLLNCYKQIELSEAAELVELGTGAEITDARMALLDYNQD
jgi:hypothetical protein